MKMMPHFFWNIVYELIIFSKKLLYRYKRKEATKSSKVNRRITKVLVLASKAGIGNAIEATPLIQAIRMLWPTSDITFAPPSADIFNNWCVPDRIITKPHEIEGETFEHTFVAYIYEDIKPWRESVSLGRIHVLRNWQTKWFLKPEREYYLDLLKPFGYKTLPPPCYVSLKKPTIEPPDSKFRICIVPCGKSEDRWKHKRWPYYPELIHALRYRYPDAQVCVLGTKDDDIKVEFDGRGIIDFRSYTLRETAWLLKQSDWVIGNDCGPMHIADAVQAKGIVIFGPTCIIKNGPRNKIVPLSFNLPCQPCHNYGNLNKCNDPICMTNISVEMVMLLFASLKERG